MTKKEMLLATLAAPLLFVLLTRYAVNNKIAVPEHDTIEVMNEKLQGRTIATDSVSLIKDIYHRIVKR